MPSKEEPLLLGSDEISDGDILGGDGYDYEGRRWRFADYQTYKLYYELITRGKLYL